VPVSTPTDPTADGRGDKSGRPAIVWFRRDLRLDDNPAWAAATTTHREILPLFVLDPYLLGIAGPFRRRQLLADLAALDATLRSRGGALRVVTGDATAVVPREAARQGASAVFVNLDVSPLARRRDDTVRATLDGSGVRWQSHWGCHVHAPGAVRTARGTLSQVFTAYWRTWLTTPHAPWPAESERTGSEHTGSGHTARIIDDPAERIPPPDGQPAFAPGELGAHRRLAELDMMLDDYPRTRDIPAIDGTTQLSAALRFGTISPRRIIDVIGSHSPGREAVVRQLAWRDWYAHTTFERPDIARHARRPEYDRIEWRDDPTGFEAWRAGRSGYPIVDAGMRQLAQTGWMHNRVRMITASFLVKDLLIDWRKGERWFRTMLVDGEVSQNAGNWQWVAGTGPDAAPYFRIFNPTSQGKKFDPRGDYVTRWVPELAGLDAATVHEPWKIGGLFGATDYPAPIVDHAFARERCLAAYARARTG
jgi:deoxyribodipyrimidine photo-lyase